MGGDGGGDRLPLRTPRLAVPVGVFLASRLVELAAAHASRLVGGRPLTGVLSAWDGYHYLRIVSEGYPAQLAQGHADAAAQTTHAFFPVYPALVEATADVSGLAPVTAGVAVSVVLGAAAIAVIWLLARDLLDEGAATRSVVLLSFFPGAYVLGMVYSEATFMAAAGTCLLALHRRRWVVAGLAAAVGGACRPTGLVLAACCLWAAVAAVRGGAGRRALAAPALAPLGFVAWSLFLWRRTGSATAWVRSQERGWDQRFDGGAHTVRSIWRFLGDPLVDFNRLVSVLTLVALAAGLWLLWRWRPPAPLVLYTVGIAATTVLSSVLTSTPRFVLSAFPLHLAAARSVSGTAFAVVAAVSAGCMALLMVVATASFRLTP